MHSVPANIAPTRAKFLAYETVLDFISWRTSRTVGVSVPVMLGSIPAVNRPNNPPIAKPEMTKFLFILQSCYTLRLNNIYVVYSAWVYPYMLKGRITRVINPHNWPSPLIDFFQYLWQNILKWERHFLTGWMSIYDSPLTMSQWDGQYCIQH